MTRKTKPTARLWKELLERRSLMIVEAVATIFMCILKFTHKGIVYVCKKPIGDFFPGVLCTLSFKIFQAHTFFFKFVYLSRQRRLLGMGEHEPGLGVNNYTLELDSAFVLNAHEN